jgi:hypothetical protein
MKNSLRIDWAEVERIAKNIRVNKELDKYEGKVLFPEKLAKANELLKGVKLPK